MGYYLQTPGNHNKAAELALMHGGEVVTQEKAAEAMNDPSKGVICVVDNGAFEAAAFAYSQSEFDVFTRPEEMRPRTFAVIDRRIAEMETGYGQTAED
jgi:hypothetical protein